MSWQPWIDFKNELEGDIEEISEPPCKTCVHFRPRVTFDKLYGYSGVRICNTRMDMEQDFSCYQEVSISRDHGK